MMDHMIHFCLAVISLEFRCNGTGVARAYVTIAVSNRSHHGNHIDIDVVIAMTMVEYLVIKCNNY